MASDFLKQKAEEARKLKNQGVKVSSSAPGTGTTSAPKASTTLSQKAAEVRNLKSLGLNISSSAPGTGTMQTGPVFKPKTATTYKSSFRDDEDRKKRIKEINQELGQLTTQLSSPDFGLTDLRAMREAQGRKASLELELKTLQNEKKYLKDQNKDTFWGQAESNYDLGELGQEVSKAWNTYLDNPTKENREYAERVGKLQQQYQQNNKDALDDEGLIRKSFAGYLPQLKDQVGASIGGAVAGGMVGGAAGAKVGATAGSGIYSYQTMRGSAFKALLDAGVDEATARKAANDEAVISSLIEMADTGLDIITFGGFGQLASAISGGFAKATAKNAATKFVGALAKYVANVIGEGLEEGAQEAVSIANKRRQTSGNYDGSLVGDAMKTAWGGITGKDKEAREQMWEAAKEGAKISAVMGGIDAGVGGVTTTVQDRIVAREGDMIRSHFADDQLISDALTYFSDDSDSYNTALKWHQEIKAGKRSDYTALEIGQLNRMMQQDLKDKKILETKKAELEQKITERRKIAELRELAETTQNPAEQQYAEAQLEHTEETVVSPTAQTLMEEGKAPDVAVEQAEILRKIEAGHVSNKEANALKLTDPAVRAAFIKVTGVAISDADARNAAKARKIIKSAAEVAAQKKATETTLKALDDARAEQARQNAQENAANQLNEAIAAEEQARAEVASETPVQPAAADPMAEMAALNAHNPGAMSLYQDRGLAQGDRYSVGEVKSETRSAETADIEPTAAEATHESETRSAEHNTGVKEVKAKGATARTLQRLNNLGKKLGVTVGYADLGDVENAHYDADTKTLYLNSRKATGQFSATYYFAHEITHSARDVDSKLVDDMLKAAEAVMGADKIAGNTEKVMARYKAHYASVGRDPETFKTENAREEVAADFFMEAIGDRKILDKLTGNDPKLVQRILDRLENLIGRGKKDKTNLRELEKLAGRMRKSLVDAQMSAAGVHIDEFVEKYQERNPGKRFSLDSDYIDAVNSGDMEAAQQLVDEAAKQAGYTIKAYHGTNADFTVFDKNRLGKGVDQYGAGFYFGNHTGVTEAYGTKTYPVYLKIEKPITIRRTQTGNESLRDVEVTKKQAVEILKRHPLMYTEESPLGDFYEEFWDKGAKAWMIQDLAGKYTSLGYMEGDLFKDYPNEFHEAVRDVTGYDGVVVYIDYGNFVEEQSDYFYVAWFDNQMKSSEPVARDDSGEIIPLSERFNESNNDIRYSLSGDNTYHQGNIQQRVLDLLRTDTLAAAEAEINRWMQDVDDGKIQMTDADKAFRDGLLRRKTVTPAEAAQNRAELDRMIQKSGLLERGEKPVRAVFLPRETVEQRKVSRTSRTVAEAQHTPQWMVDEIERAVVKGDSGFTYEVATDKRAMDYVERISQKSFEANLADWDTIVKSGAGSGILHSISKQDIALGEFLYTEAVKMGAAGNREGTILATRLVAELAAIGTQAGQTVQAMSLLKKLTPSGQLYYLQKTVERLNRDLEKKGKGNIVIDATLAQAVLAAQTQEELDAAMDKLLRDIADQTPVTVMDKWNTWRYLAMLGNPRTHIRNILSNAVFAPVTFLKDLIGIGMESMVIRDPTKRTKSMGWTRYKDFAKADFANVKDQLTSTGKQNPADLIRDKRQIFRSKGTQWINKASKFNSDWMEREDAWFLEASYTRALGQFLAARDADITTLDNTREGKVLLKEAREYAMREAQKATFRDASALASALSRLENSGGMAAKFITGSLMPFKKTPINILKRGVEYSPVGLLDTLVRGSYKLKTGEISVNEYLDKISAGLTGTSIMAIGMWMAANNMLRSNGSGGKEDELEELQGAQNYSLVIGDMSFTIDWMAPAALSLFIGCEVFDQIISGEEMNRGNLTDIMLTLAEPMFQLSMLDGLNSTLQAAAYGESATYEVGTTMLTSYVGQAMPTLLGQIARTADGTRRAAYVDKNKSTPAFISRFAQTSVAAKTPVLSETLTPRLDAWGRTDTQKNTLLGALENFILPGYVEWKKTSPMEEELERLYKVTGNTNVLPKAMSKYFNVGGARYDLSAEEWETFQTVAGQTAYSMLSDLVNGSAYRNLTDAQRAEAVADIFTYAKEKAKSAAVSTYDSEPSWIGKAEDMAKRGFSVEDYVVQDVFSKDSDESNTQDILSMSWLSDTDRANLVSVGYRKKLTGNTFTDPNRSGYEYSLTDAQVQQYEEYFETQWQAEYAKLTASNRFLNSDLAGQAKMVDELKGEVAEGTKKWMARQLRSEGIKSTKKN